MVQKQRNSNMTSEQPLKKKLRRGTESETDEPDFIHSLSESNVNTELQALHLSLPSSVNEDDITKNDVNLQLHSEVPVYRTCVNVEENSDNSDNLPIKAAPDIITSSKLQSIVPHQNGALKPSSQLIRATNHDRFSTTQHSSSDSQVISEYVQQHLITHERLGEIEQISNEEIDEYGLDNFQRHLIRQCLCGVSEAILRKPFEGKQINDCGEVRTAMLSEWSTKKVLQFLSNLQLLFDVYLKQNNKGYICSRIVTICDAIICNEYNLIEQIISLCELRNQYINFLAAKVLSSFLIIAKTNINNEWLESIVNFLTMENIDYMKMKFALEVVKRVVEWKDIEIHVLEESECRDGAGTSSQEVTENVNCITVPFSDPESYDTSAIKGLIIKSLESRWPELIHKIRGLILHSSSITGVSVVHAQACVLGFLALWESTISVKANLSVIDTKPFYAHLELFVGLLGARLSAVVWKQLLSLFNEVLCYGSTLALQDVLPDDTCQLAHLIVRYVKDYRLLDSLPFRRNEGGTATVVNSFVGAVHSSHSGGGSSNVDKTLLQKMVLLVLKSVAITVKETRSDSSDSSVGSDDSDFHQDMQLIERSIRDVLRKVETFVKNGLDFHPETPFPKVLVRLFEDQDDYMIESMVCTLDVTVGISFRRRDAVFPDLLGMLDPVRSFCEFLAAVGHDPDVLLDYLVSNETCFLLYLLRLLKHAKRDWARFVSGCGDSSGLDDTMTVLIRLKTQIGRLVSKELFPYNITPVLRLLETCENLYEGNEFS
nr:unnamed protein product [Callosobruchus analis]